MPLYEYRCADCGRDHEVLVRGEEAVECPACRSTRQERLLSVSARPQASPLSIAGGCPPAEAPPCSPHCCRLP